MSDRDDLRAEWGALKQRAIARGETVAAPYEFVERVLRMLDAVAGPAAPSDSLTRSRIEHWLRNRRLRLKADFDKQELPMSTTLDCLMALLEDLGEYAVDRGVVPAPPPERELFAWSVPIPKSAVVDTTTKGCRVYVEDGQHWMDDGSGAVPLLILRAERVRIVDDSATEVRAVPAPPPEP